MPKKNPIKKRVQGSQKPNPFTPGTPSKYMGKTTDVEQYHEPQGINSPAAKRVMKRESFSDLVDKEMVDETFGGSLGDMGMMTPMRGGDGKFAIPQTQVVIDVETGEKMAGSKAPTDKVKKTVKKSYQDKDFEDELNEMVRVPVFTLISGEYEVMDCEKPVGHARVHDGVIAELVCADGADESYRGEVLTKLLKTIIGEADAQNSPLSLQLTDKDDDDMKRFMERFGFRDVGHGIMRRTAGAISPPSVHYSDGMDEM